MGCVRTRTDAVTRGRGGARCIPRGIRHRGPASGRGNRRRTRVGRLPRPALTSASLRTGETAPQPAEFRLCFTTDALFVGVVCGGADVNSIVADGMDGDPLWDEDSVEIFLSTDGWERVAVCGQCHRQPRQPAHLARVGSGCVYR